MWQRPLLTACPPVVPGLARPAKLHVSAHTSWSNSPHLGRKLLNANVVPHAPANSPLSFYHSFTCSLQKKVAAAVRLGTMLRHSDFRGRKEYPHGFNSTVTCADDARGHFPARSFAAEPKLLATKAKSFVDAASCGGESSAPCGTYDASAVFLSRGGALWAARPGRPASQLCDDCAHRAAAEWGCVICVAEIWLALHGAATTMKFPAAESAPR